MQTNQKIVESHEDKRILSDCSKLNLSTLFLSGNWEHIYVPDLEDRNEYLVAAMVHRVQAFNAFNPTEKLLRSAQCYDKAGRNSEAAWMYFLTNDYEKAFSLSAGIEKERMLKFVEMNFLAVELKQAGKFSDAGIAYQSLKMFREAADCYQLCGNQEKYAHCMQLGLFEKDDYKECASKLANTLEELGKFRLASFYYVIAGLLEKALLSYAVAEVHENGACSNPFLAKDETRRKIMDEYFFWLVDNHHYELAHNAFHWWVFDFKSKIKVERFSKAYKSIVSGIKNVEYAAHIDRFLGNEVLAKMKLTHLQLEEYLLMYALKEQDKLTACGILDTFGLTEQSQALKISSNYINALPDIPKYKSAESAKARLQFLLDDFRPQDALWQASKVPCSRDKTEEMEESIVSRLKLSKLSDYQVLGGGKNISLIVQDEFGCKMVFKPHCDSNNTKLEHAASLVDRYYKFDIAPYVELRTLEGVSGSLQYLLRSQTSYLTFLDEIHSDYLLDVQVFDYLIGLSDRHPNNAILVDNVLRCIDNADSFHAKSFDRPENFLKSSVGQKVNFREPDKLYTQLSEFLTKKQLEAFKFRFKSLQRKNNK